MLDYYGKTSKDTSLICEDTYTCYISMGKYATLRKTPKDAISWENTKQCYISMGKHLGMLN